MWVCCSPHHPALPTDGHIFMKAQWRLFKREPVWQPCVQRGGYQLIPVIMGVLQTNSWKPIKATYCVITSPLSPETPLWAFTHQGRSSGTEPSQGDVLKSCEVISFGPTWPAPKSDFFHWTQTFPLNARVCGCVWGKALTARLSCERQELALSGMKLKALY